jgi:5-methylcytosine-specific restriction enzyme subunit McrC
MYAMLAYCTAFGVRHGYLVSPGNPADKRAHQITGSGITITEWLLDLDQPPVEVRRQVCDLAREILSQG